MSRAAELTLQNLQLPTALRERRCKLALGSHHLNDSRHQSPLQFPIVRFLYTIRILSIMQNYTCYLILIIVVICIVSFVSHLFQPPFFYTHYSHSIHISSAVISMLSALFFCFKRLVEVTCIWYTQVADILHFFGIADLLLEGVDQIS